MSTLERRGDVALVGVDEIEPLAQAPVAALERDERGLVRRVDLERPARGACAARSGLRNCSSWMLASLHQDVDALALGGDDVELLLEDADELRPLLRRLRVDALEAAHGERGSTASTSSTSR